MSNANAAQQIVCNIREEPTRLRLIYIAVPQGAYIGSLEIDTTDSTALLAIANQFQSWAADRAGGIQVVAPGSQLAINGGKRS